MFSPVRALSEPAESRDQGTGSLLQPEVILPSQFYNPSDRLSGVEGERRLMLAILEDAVFCIVRHHSSRDVACRRLAQEAQCWVNRKGTGYIYNFEAICETLGIEVDLLRNRVRQLTRISVAAAEAKPMRRVRWRVGRARKVRPPRVRNRTQRTKNQETQTFPMAVNS